MIILGIIIKFWIGSVLTLLPVVIISQIAEALGASYLHQVNTITLVILIIQFISGIFFLLYAKIKTTIK